MVWNVIGVGLSQLLCCHILPCEMFQSRRGYVQRLHPTLDPISRPRYTGKSYAYLWLYLFCFCTWRFFKEGKTLPLNFRSDVPTIKSEFGLACWTLQTIVALRNVPTSKYKKTKFCNCIICIYHFTYVKIHTRDRLNNCYKKILHFLMKGIMDFFDVSKKTVY